MSHKKNFFLTLSIIVTLVALQILLSVVLDPLFQFRITPYRVKSKEREFYPGLAKNYDYTTAILGTSTSQNLLAEDAEKIFSSKVINLSLSGSTSYEQRKIMDLVLNKKGLNTIIYGLDVFSFNRGTKESRIPITEYLYSDNFLNKLKYSLSYDSLKKNITLIEQILNDEKFDSNWIKKNSYWGDQYVFSKKQTLNFDKSGQNLGIIKEFKSGYNKENMLNNLKIFSKKIDDNPQIKFYIYFPPYATLFWSFAEKYGQLETITAFKVEAIKRLKKFPNVKIYDFQENFIITSNLNNYKDLVHHSPLINKKIINAISINDNLVIEDEEKHAEILKKQTEATNKKYNLILQKKY